MKHVKELKLISSELCDMTHKIIFTVRPFIKTTDAKNLTV